MKMDKNIQDDAALDALFDAGRANEPQATDDFMARLMADAVPPKPQRQIEPQAPSPLFGKLKGLFAASGLSGAAVLGLWIGFIMPETVGTYTLLTEDTVGLYTFLPGADLMAPGIDE